MTRNKIIDNDMVLLKVVLSFNSFSWVKKNFFSWVNFVSRVTLNQVLTSIHMHSQFLFLHMHILFFFFSFFSFETVIPKRFAPDDEKLKILSIFKYSHYIENLYFSNHQYANFHYFLIAHYLIFNKYIILLYNIILYTIYII